MPTAQQGDIHDYDFGPVIGAELSGRRPALVISNDEFNESYGTALVLPMSSTMPAERYRNQQHVYIAATDSWASTRQIKTAHQGRLGAAMGQASASELASAIESLARRFTRGHCPGRIITPEGDYAIDTGTLWQIPFTEAGGGSFLSTVLVIDYNAGNNIAITVEVEERASRANAPTDVPITIVNSGQRATALIHRVRTIDAGERDLVAAGHTRRSEVRAAISRLLAAVEPRT